jgi:hypothetical protein
MSNTRDVLLAQFILSLLKKVLIIDKYSFNYRINKNINNGKTKTNP